MRAALLLVLLLAPASAAAHGSAGEATSGDLFDLTVAVLLAVTAALYAAGIASLWRRAGIGRGVRGWRVWSFALGLLTLVLALIWPLPGLSALSFPAHMVEHEALMAVAAPLLVLARPGAVFLWALPDRAGAYAVRIGRTAALRRLWRAGTEPLSATMVHGVALWIWHVPALFDAALANNAVHALQHLMFFVSAICFWWAMLERAREGGREGVAVLALFATASHMGLLGALLTVSPLLWYSPASGSPAGPAALADQQLAGLLMWIPAGFVYAAAAIGLFVLWLEGVVRRRRSHV
jgi:cytochrome c oxidase assembly factor CtaG